MFLDIVYSVSDYMKRQKMSANLFTNREQVHIYVFFLFHNKVRFVPNTVFFANTRMFVIYISLLKHSGIYPVCMETLKLNMRDVGFVMDVYMFS